MVSLFNRAIPSNIFISYYHQARPINWPEVFGNKRPLDVELGSGLGEFLIRTAGVYPRRNFVGIEQDWKRVKKTLTKFLFPKAPSPAGGLIKNIRLVKANAGLALERFFSPKTLSRVFCLFPCPWPKDRHIKHRLFSKDFLRLLNSRLKAKGEALIVTDHLAYYKWILAELAGTGFKVNRNVVGAKFDTKYERKWQNLGQKKFYQLRLIKTKHIVFPLKEDEELKTYHVKRFDARTFNFKDRTGPVSVILKDFLYDEKKRKAIVNLLVSEEHLTQYIWVVIAPSKKGWCIKKAEGQLALPSQGVAEAVRLVYEAVKGS